MIRGPIQFKIGTVLCLHIEPNSISMNRKVIKYNKTFSISQPNSWISIGIVKFVTNTKVVIELGDSSIRTLDKNSSKIIGVAVDGIVPNKNNLLIPSSQKDEYVKYYYTKYDTRISRRIKEDFEGNILDAIGVYEDKNSIEPLYVYPNSFRFDVGEIVKATFLKDKAWADVDRQGFVKIIRTELSRELLDNEYINIPKYSVRKAYTGISAEEWNQNYIISDIKIDKTLALESIPRRHQESILRMYFKPFYR